MGPVRSGKGKDKKSRKKRFSPQENRILITEVVKHHQRLFVTSTVSLATKNGIWQSIVDKVNAVGVLKRSIQEVKRRWNDIKRKTQQKLANNRKAAMQTGGGSPAPQEEMEEMVSTVISRETVAGVGGPDTAQHDRTQQHQEGKPMPPAEQSKPLISDDEEDHHTFDPDALQQFVDRLRTRPPGAGQPSCIEKTQLPAKTTQQAAPTTTAASQDPHEDHMAFQRRVLGGQEQLAEQVRVGFNRMAAKLDAILACLSPLRDNSQSPTETHSPLHALQRTMADIAGVLTLRQEQLSSRSGSSDVTRELGHMRRLMETMVRTQAERAAATAAHQRVVAGYLNDLKTLLMALLPQGLGLMNAAATTTSTSQPPEVSVPLSAADIPPTAPEVSLPQSAGDRTPPPTSEAHETAEDENADESDFLIRRKL
ncbi:uncharacterized protein LOC144766645 [Lissotriton helveticus]